MYLPRYSTSSELDRTRRTFLLPGSVKTIGYLLPALLGHALGMAAFINWHDLWYNPPIHFTDYAAEYADVSAVRRFLSEGQLWGYDPFFHAGLASGTLLDIDNKAIELTSWLLSLLGLSLPHAFNIVIVLLLAVVPFMVYFSGRIIGLSQMAAGLAQCIAVVIWYGEPTVSWMWQGGTPTFSGAALGSLVVVAGFWRWAAHKEDRWLGLAVWFGLGPLLFWLHAGAFCTLVVPLSLGVLIFWRRWSWRARAVPLLWSICVLIINWPWLSLALRFLPTKTASDQFLQADLGTLLRDFSTPYMGLRLALLGLAALGLRHWRRLGTQPWLLTAAGIGSGVTLAYAGVYIGLGDTQPYRFLIPALFWAVLPASSFVEQVWQGSPRNAVVCLLALSLLAARPLYWEIPRGHRQPDGTPADQLSGPQPAEHAVCTELRTRDLQSGRVLINDWRMGAWLPDCSGAQVIGGPALWVWTTYGYTNAGLWDAFNIPVKQLSPDALSTMLTRYNVCWIVINTTLSRSGYTFADWARDYPGLLVARWTQGPWVIYEVQLQPSWFLIGTGAVVADYNRLEVHGASPGGLLLKYHWIDTLRTEPPLPIRPVRIGEDPVPFIAVDNGHVTDFVIVQDYQMQKVE